MRIRKGFCVPPPVWFKRQAALPGTDTSYAQADRLFLRGADGRFAAHRLSAAPPSVSRSAVAGDLAPPN